MNKDGYSTVPALQVEADMNDKEEEVEVEEEKEKGE